MFSWLQNNEVLLWWLAAGSVIFFLISLLFVPIILIRLPVDYFSHDKKFRSPWARGHPLIHVPLLLIKNVLGTLLIIGGIFMLALPGQGILTILVGLVLLDFPGKYQAERWVVERKYILRSINWIRAKYKQPALITKKISN